MDEKLELIVNKKFTTFLIKNINSIWNNTRCNESLFPGAQPVSLERKNIEKLNKYVYYVGPRTKGIRCILYFLNDKNGKNQCILINRNLQVFNVHINADDTLYYGTIFDGELYINGDKPELFIHDSPIICSNKIIKNSFNDRIDEIKCCIENSINMVQSDINLIVKKFFPITDMVAFKNYYEDSDTQGMVFIPDSLPVISGTQYSMFIWRPINDYTFDFEMHEESDDIIVKVFNMGEIINYAKVHYSDKDGKTFIDSLKKLYNYKNRSIVRCSFSKVFIPQLIMDDKSHPNSLRTIERILFNIHENIMIEEFE